MNLRIRRIIDFKSIALDHSATLSLHLFGVSHYMSHRVSVGVRSHQSEGSVAQMVEHSLCMRGAGGSIPPTSIVLFIVYCLLFVFSYLIWMGGSTQHSSRKKESITSRGHEKRWRQTVEGSVNESSSVWEGVSQHGEDQQWTIYNHQQKSSIV